MSTQVDGVNANVDAVKQNVASTRSDLDKTGADLKRVMGDMGVMSGLIATTPRTWTGAARWASAPYFEFRSDQLQGS